MMSVMLEKQLHSLLCERLPSIGFSAFKRLRYSRAVTSDCQQMIVLPTRQDGRKLLFSCNLWVRFSSIESLLRPDSDDESFPTAGCPIHFLTHEREFFEWEGGNLEDLEIAADSLVDEVVAVGLPFFERFSDIDQVKAELSAPTPSEYFAFSPHQRVSTLAAIHLVQGDRAKAESVVSHALSEPGNQHPGRRRRLQEIQEQLLGR